jgi:hypothetical protein
MPTLGEFLDLRPKLPLPDAIAIIRAIAVQVVELHRMGRFHGEICDRNIVLDDACQPRFIELEAGPVTTGPVTTGPGNSATQIHLWTWGIWVICIPDLKFRF